MDIVRRNFGRIGRRFPVQRSLGIARSVFRSAINRDRTRYRQGRFGMSRFQSRLGKRGPIGMSRSVKRIRSIAPSIRRSFAPATTVSRFARPSRVNRTAFSAAGYQREAEVYGTYTCPEVAHIGVQSVRIGEIGEVVGVALLRYIMKKECLMYYKDDSEIINQGFGSTTGTVPIGITFYGTTARTDASLTTTAMVYNVASDTLQQFGVWFSSNVFNNLSAGGDDSASSTFTELTGYSLTYFDAGAGNKPTAIRDLRTIKLSVYSKATLKIQNVTAGNNGGLEVTDIGSNPLEGRMFQCKGLVPRVNQSSQFAGGTDFGSFFNQSVSTSRPGILLPATLPTGNAQGVLNPRDFNYCVNTASVKINPGQIKYYSIGFKFNGLLNRLITGFAQNSASGITARSAIYKDKMGDCMMISLEKVVRTGPTPVVVGYHADWHTGAKVTGFQIRVMNKSNRPAVLSDVTIL